MTRHVRDYNQGDELIEVRHESTNCEKFARDLGAMTGLFFFTIQIDFCEGKLKQHKTTGHRLVISISKVS